jgi:type II secretion system protein G
MPRQAHVKIASPATRNAFTLVELLVVIAIIGLLSSIATIGLNSARIQSRDAKRKADLLQISKAIEMYANDNGSLPCNTAGWCTYISNAANGWGATFQAGISPYLSKTPLDPTMKNQVGDYFYKNSDNRTQYVLCANMEKSTGNSYNYSACTNGTTYNYCLMPNGGS